MSDTDRIAALESVVVKLNELATLQPRRIDLLEASDNTVDVFLAQRSADEGKPLARGAAVLAASR